MHSNHHRAPVKEIYWAQHEREKESTS
jgi:hypothetical protein